MRKNSSEYSFELLPEYWKSERQEELAKPDSLSEIKADYTSYVANNDLIFYQKKQERTLSVFLKTTNAIEEGNQKFHGDCIF